MDSGETPEQAATREVMEEAGYHGAMKLVPLYIFKHQSGFTYYNFLAIVQDEFEPDMDWETQGYEWIMPPKWPSPLHMGMNLLLKDTKSMGIINGLVKRYSGQ